MLVDEIARVCHEANRALQILQSDPTPSPPWEDAPEWQRDSALSGVEAALAGATPAEQHEAWCSDKEADGWVWGPVKDAEQLTHPCLVTYGLLPEDQKIKDRLFVAIVAALTSGDEARRDDEEVLVSGGWGDDESGRRVHLNGVPLRKVRAVDVRDDVDFRPFQLVTIELLTKSATVLPPGSAVVDSELAA